MSTALIWFRRDLRLTGNPALAAACERHEHVIPVFIWAEDEEAPWQPGGASRWWLHHSLAALSRALAGLGSPLVIRRGDSLAELRALARETGAEAIHWNRLYEPALIARDKRIKQTLREEGLEAESFNGALWFEPWEMKTLGGEPYRVFTPFWKSMQTKLAPRRIAPAPERLAGPAKPVDSLPLDTLNLLPKIPWDRGFYEHWTPGEAGALARLESFCEDDISRYQDERDFPAQASTSRLSPHLHFGEISPDQIHIRVQRLLAENPGAGVLKNAGGFLREVAWREFAHHLLFHFPHTPLEPMYEKFGRLPWRGDAAEDLRHWQRGRTGIPIVDAGLRELWATGIMHNRVRMIAASLLTKNLLVHWREGARWFWDTLVDASLANNTLGWQWVAGCGADAAPYYRIFNPVLQSRKFDATGAYIRRWVPELAGLPDEDLHAPWEADAITLSTAGIVLGKNYPHPIVDLAATRERALDAYQRTKDA